MSNIYNILKFTIARGGYKLDDINRRIKRFFSTGDLTDIEMDELMMLAVDGASSTAERPDANILVDILIERCEKLEERIASLENHLFGDEVDEGGIDGEPEVTPKYENWEPWDGLSKKYQYGDIVIHNDELWKSIFNGQNVWEPGAVGVNRLWEKYTETVEEVEGESTENTNV